MSMAHANRLSRGDLRRNARLERLRRVVSHDCAVLAVELADDIQVVVVCDHDSRVLARRTWRCRPWQLDRALGWWSPVSRPGTAGGWWSSRPPGWGWRSSGCSRCWWVGPARLGTSPGTRATTKTLC